MQTKEQFNTLKVYRYNEKNYLTGISLLLIGYYEYIISENQNMLYEIPQYIIDDLYYNMPNLYIEYHALEIEQIKYISKEQKDIILTKSIEKTLENTLLKYKEVIVQDVLDNLKKEYQNNGYDIKEIEWLLQKDEKTIKDLVEIQISKKTTSSNSNIKRR